MATRYVNIDRETPLLLPPDLRDWVAGDDLVHFVLEAMEGADVTGVRVRQHGGGSLGYPPRMMMALLIYAYANGLFGSRQIERATYYHVSVRYLCGNHHPDHDTICTFRRENRPLLKLVFTHVLKLAATMGILQVGTVCIDGTKVLADAAKRRTLDWDQLQEAETRVQQKIERLLEEAEATDSRAAGDRASLPEELKSRQKLKAKLQEARERLSEMVKERAQSRQQEREQWASDPVGTEPRPKKPNPQETDRINLTDMECGLMPLHTGGYAPGYNAQAAITGEHRGLILTTNVTTQTNDRQQLQPMVELAIAEVAKVDAESKINRFGTDTGYDHARQIKGVQERFKVEVYCPPNPAPEKQGPPKGRVSKVRKLAAERAAEVHQQMRTQLDTDEGKQIMELRRTTVEPAFGIIKRVLGFRRFSLRGLEKVSTEWELVALAFNCRRIARQSGKN